MYACTYMLAIAGQAIIRSDITWYFNFKTPEKKYYLILQVKTPEKTILPNTSS